MVRTLKVQDKEKKKRGMRFGLASGISHPSRSPNLKGSKYILLKREEHLKKEQKERLNIVKEASAKLAVMHELKEEFTAIFDRSNNLG